MPIKPESIQTSNSAKEEIEHPVLLKITTAIAEDLRQYKGFDMKEYSQNLHYNIAIKKARLRHKTMKKMMRHSPKALDQVLEEDYYQQFINKSKKPSEIFERIK